MVKDPPANAGGAGSIPGWGRSPWRRAWPPSPVFLLGDSMDRGAWRATVHRIAENRTWLKQLSRHALGDKTRLPGLKGSAPPGCLPLQRPTASPSGQLCFWPTADWLELLMTPLLDFEFTRAAHRAPASYKTAGWQGQDSGAARGTGRGVRKGQGPPWALQLPHSPSTATCSPTWTLSEPCPRGVLWRFHNWWSHWPLVIESPFSSSLPLGGGRGEQRVKVLPL